MPSRKPALKAMRNATSGVQFVNFPRLHIPFSWSEFLPRLLNTPQNKEAFTRCEHAEIVELLRRQADEQFKNDSERLKRAIAGVRDTCIAVSATADSSGRSQRRAAKMYGHVLKLR